jgi:hypothetical protein
MVLMAREDYLGLVDSVARDGDGIAVSAAGAASPQACLVGVHMLEVG